MNHLRGVFLVVEVNGKEAVVRGEVERRVLAGGEEVGDVFALGEGHVGGLEFDAGRWEGEVDESGGFVSGV